MKPPKNKPQRYFDTYQENRDVFQFFVDYELLNDNKKIRLFWHYDTPIKHTMRTFTIRQSSDLFWSFGINFEPFKEIQANEHSAITTSFSECYRKCSSESRYKCIGIKNYKGKCKFLTNGNQTVKCSMGETCAKTREYKSEIILDYSPKGRLCYMILINGIPSINAVCPSDIPVTIGSLEGSWMLDQNRSGQWLDKVFYLGNQNTDVGRLFLLDKSLFNEKLEIKRWYDIWSIINLSFKNNKFQFILEQEVLQSVEFFTSFYADASIISSNAIKILIHNLSGDKVQQSINFEAKSHDEIKIEIKVPRYNVTQAITYLRIK